MVLEIVAPSPGSWLLAFGLTIALEVPVVLGLGRHLEPQPWRRAGVALLANLLTHPAVWFVFPALRLGWIETTALSETWAWLAEAAVYRAAFRTAGWPAALALSLLANLLSFSVGLALWALGVLE